MTWTDNPRRAGPTIADCVRDWRANARAFAWRKVPLGGRPMQSRPPRWTIRRSRVLRRGRGEPILHEQQTRHVLLRELLPAWEAAARELTAQPTRRLAAAA